MPPEILRARIAALLSPAAIPADQTPFLTDQRRRYTSTGCLVVQPESVGQVQELVRFCAAHRITITPQGGNTGLVGGSVAAGGIVLNLSRLNKIRSISTADNALTADAGCVLHRIQAAAAKAGCFFPLNLASGGSCQIGGNIACNAGGLNVLRYGTMRDLVLGLEVVLPDGSLVSHLSPLHKNTTGYELKHLFIGSEGTLGIITGATLKLFAPPQSRATAWIGLDGIQAAVCLLERVRSRFAERLCSFELVGAAALDLSAKHSGLRKPVNDAPWHILLELADSLPEADTDSLLAEFLSVHGYENAVIAQSEQQRTELWALRENISAAQRSLGANIKHDIALPVSRIADFVPACEAALHSAFPNAQVVLFGHLGDGSLHYNVCLPQTRGSEVYRYEDEVNKIVYRETLRLEGTIAAEHGIGSLKRHLLPTVRSAAEIALMRAVKAQLDPRNLFNPGKLLPD